MKIKINTNKNEPIVDTVKPYPDENPNQVSECDCTRIYIYIYLYS